ncbi:SPOR domain-containing protein [Aestuariivivens sediminis]|uniref:SPOR domain-containing protein n=1 Tax=Aestuariivivens sediminis TaxID=2913557 RepID=UPI001F57252C|nr:SPOR domain-containing protein [Aestuariivivens sediminis]
MKSLPFKIILSLAVFCILSTNYTQAQQGHVILNQDKSINNLLDLKKEINQESNDYYKIQIYSGDRTGAQNAQKEFHLAFDNWKSRLEYESPNFKIWVGNYRIRLEADRALRQIKQKFSGAFIFKPKK